MKRFMFSLEALLEKRKRAEEAVTLELANKNREIDAGQRTMQNLEQELKNLQEQQKKTRSSVTDVFTLKYAVSYRNKLKLDMLNKGQDIYRLQMERGDIRKRLIKATQKKKALEILKEKRYREWALENKQMEQLFLDDVSQQGFIRKQRAAKKHSPA